jgi:hypothetical protein
LKWEPERKKKKDRRPLERDSTSPSASDFSDASDKVVVQKSTIQKTMAQFVDIVQTPHPNPDTSSTVVSSSATQINVNNDSSYLSCDMTIEMYKYGHSKNVDSRDQHKDLHAMKQDLWKEYGIMTDARRFQIANFNVEIGVTNCEKTFMASTQVEWEKMRMRFYSGCGQNSITGKYNN